MPGRPLHQTLARAAPAARAARGAGHRASAEALSLVTRALTQADAFTIEERAGGVMRSDCESRDAAAACTITCVIQDADASRDLTPASARSPNTCAKG